MKLSQKERDIICCTQLKADALIQEVARSTGYREHTVRYCLQRAIERGIIRRRCFINLQRLGLLQHQIYFSLSSERRDARQKLLRALIDSDRVSWIGKLGGDFQYGMNICTDNVRELADFLDQLSSRFQAVFLDKVVAVRISFTYFGNKYLSKKRGLRKSLAYETTKETLSIDEVDHRILSAITGTEFKSVRQLARIMGMPQTTLDYRIKKLEQGGIVVGYYYEVQPDLIGMQAFMLLISVKGITAAFRQRFAAFCEKHPQIVILIHSFGSWDFEAGVEVDSASAITSLTEELYDEFGAGINWIKVLPSFGYPKVQEYPFKTLRV